MKKDIKRMIRFFSLFKSLWIPYLISTLVVASRNFVITLLNASISRKAVEMISYQEHIIKTILQICIWVICFAIADSLGVYSQTTVIHKISTQLRGKMFRHAIHSTVAGLDKFGKRDELISRMNYDIDNATALLSYGLLSPIMCCISGIGATMIIFGTDWKICLFIYASGLLAFLLQILLSKYLRNRIACIQRDK